MSQFAEELRNLASPMAESLSDGRRLTLFIHAATSAANHIDSLEKELARRDMQLEASAKVALKLLSDNQRLLEALEEVEEYLDDRSDADYGDTGFVPNTEMRLLAVVRAALNEGHSPEP